MLIELLISRVDSLCTLEKYQTETTAKDMTFSRAFKYHVFILQNYILIWIFLFMIMFAFIVVIWFFDFSLFGEFEKFQYCTHTVALLHLVTSQNDPVVPS